MSTTLSHTGLPGQTHSNISARQSRSNILKSKYYLHKVHNSTKEDNGVTEAAEALAPAVSKESRDPEWEKTEPEHAGENEVLEPILARVDVGRIMCSRIGRKCG